MDIDELLNKLEGLISELENTEIEENIFTVEDIIQAIYGKRDGK